MQVIPDGDILPCMTDQVPTPVGGAFGWVVEVADVHQKKRLQVRIRYFAAVADKATAVSAVRHFARLGKNTLLRTRHALSKRDVTDLNLRPGEIRKVRSKGAP